MKFSFRIILLCITFHIAGCTPHVKLKLFNNTGGIITVQANNKRLTIPENYTGEMNYYSLTPNFPMSVARYKLTLGEDIKTYNIIHFPPSYVKPLAGGLKGYEILFQIQPNGFIYVLPPESSTPVLKLDSQPSGYPLEPS